MTTLYNIVENLLELDQLIGGIMEDERLTEEEKSNAAEELVKSYLESEGNLKDKLANCINYINELEAVSKIRREESRRLANLAKNNENKSERLRKYVVNHLSRIGIKRIELTNNVLTVRKKPDELEITCALEELPDKYKRVKIEPDKIELKKALKEQSLEYARLVPSEEYSLRIK